MPAEPYRVIVSGRARRDLHALPEPVAVAVPWTSWPGPLIQNPQRVGKPLRGELAGLHSARRGATTGSCNRIDDESRTVEVQHIDHGTDVYRP